MFSSRLFWKIFLTGAGLNLLAVAGLALACAAYGTELGKSAFFWLVIVAAGIAVTGVSYWVAVSVVRPIVILSRATNAIAMGDYRQRVYVPLRDELGALCQSFDRMSRELDVRMTQLRQSVERQATVLGGMNEGVIAVDERERVVFANQAAGQLFDFRPPTAEGRPLLEVVRHHTLHEAVSAALADGQPLRLEISWNSSQAMTVAIQATPLPGQPCPGAVLVLHDVTELRRLETLRQEFIANVSHELKTPLSSIKAYAETLQNGAITDRETSLTFIRRIEEQSDRLHHLILDMLMLARIESEQQVFEIVPLSVDDVVDACLEFHRPAADAKAIAMTTEALEADLRVQADPEGLRQILDNLLDNAIKYTPHGGKVTVRWGPDVADEQKMIRIDVQDTGIGLADDQLSRIFERFYRVDKARSRELGGTGLGLSIVKHLAQSFRGRVAAESSKGKGSVFSVYLLRA